MNTQADRVTASPVAEGTRLDFLPTFFGPRLMIRGEALVYAWMRGLSKQYDGGYWNYYTLSNGGYYMAPNLKTPLTVQVDGNGFRGEMSADAAGVVATFFALGQLCAENEGSAVGDALIDHYNHLHDYAGDHPERAAIFQAID